MSRPILVQGLGLSHLEKCHIRKIEINNIVKIISTFIMMAIFYLLFTAQILRYSFYFIFNL